MNTLQILERIAALDALECCVYDDRMVEALAQLPARIPAILRALALAADACASLDNILVHLGGRMTVADEAARTKVAAELEQALHALAFLPGAVTH